MLVGAVADPDLGPVLAVGASADARQGLGRSTAFRVLPLMDADADADELIDASRSVAAELDGFRGSEPLDRQSLRELILRLALLLRRVSRVGRSRSQSDSLHDDRLCRARHPGAD